MIYILVVFLAIFTVFVFYASKGIPRTISEIERPIEDLLNRGFDGGTLVITNKRNKNFVQFKKYAEDGVKGIIFSLPSAPWSEKYYPIIKDLASSKGIQGSEKNLGMTFFEIDFGYNSNSAYSFTKETFLSALEARENDKYYVSLKGARSN